MGAAERLKPSRRQRLNDEIAAAAADFMARVMAVLADNTPEFYSQDNPPPGMKPRTYLDHCYRGSWENRREGRLRVTDVAAYEAWNANRRHAAKPRLVPEVEEIADEDEYIKSGGRRGR